MTRARSHNSTLWPTYTTGLGHGSIVFKIEAHIAYLANALRAMRRRSAGALEARTEAQAASGSLFELAQLPPERPGECSPVAAAITSDGKAGHV